jgi:hypothetical protein
MPLAYFFFAGTNRKDTRAASRAVATPIMILVLAARCKLLALAAIAP